LVDNDTNGTVVYDELKLHHHNHTNDFNLLRKIKENPGMKAMVIPADAK
jgi:hypothetical protein